MLARAQAAKALFLERKQSIDWTQVQRDWDGYFKNQAPDNWREEFMPLVRGVTADANEVWTAELGIQFNVQNLFELAALEFEAYGMTFAQEPLETTVSDLFSLLRTASSEGWTIEKLNAAIDRLWAVYLENDALSDEERQWFVDRSPRYRVEMISRTESMHSANFGSTELFKAYGANEHEWVTAQDDRVRPTHRAANGQVRVIGQPFEVGNSLMLYPLDGSLGAEAGEIVNCRCVTVPTVESIMGSGEE